MRDGRTISQRLAALGFENPQGFDESVHDLLDVFEALNRVSCQCASVHQRKQWSRGNTVEAPTQELAPL